jgi:hypothetical protein
MGAQLFSATCLVKKESRIYAAYIKPSCAYNFFDVSALQVIDMTNVNAIFTPVLLTSIIPS